MTIEELAKRVGDLEAAIEKLQGQPDPALEKFKEFERYQRNTGQQHCGPFCPICRQPQWPLMPYRIAWSGTTGDATTRLA